MYMYTCMLYLLLCMSYSTCTYMLTVYYSSVHKAGEYTVKCMYTGKLSVDDEE